MRNKQSSTLEKTVKLFAKAMCFAILFSLVFGILFTSGTVFDFSPLTKMNDDDYALAAGFSQREILEPNTSYAEGDIELNASHFKDAKGNTFPIGNKWRISTKDGNETVDKLYFNNTSNWRNSMSFRGDLQGNKAGSVNVINQPQWNNGQPYSSEKNKDDGSGGNINYGVPYQYYNLDADGNPVGNPIDGKMAKGFTVQATNVDGYVVLGVALKIKNSPFIEQLIYDNRYTVKARLRQKVHYLQQYARKETFLPMKTRIEATGDVKVDDSGNYDPSGQKTAEFQANHIHKIFTGKESEVFWYSQAQGVAPPLTEPAAKIADRKAHYLGLGFRDSDTWRAGKKEHAWDKVPGSDTGGDMIEEQQSYSLGFMFDPDNNNFIDEENGFNEEGTMVLSPETPYITCEYVCGMAGNKTGDYPMDNSNLFRVWDMAVEYEITRNETAGSGTEIRDGAAPRPVSATEISPFSPTSDKKHNWPVYSTTNEKYNNAFISSAPTDSVYADSANTIPNDVVVLSSYIKKTAVDQVWKTITMEYEDQFLYPGNLHTGLSPSKYAGGIKSISFSGKIPDNKPDSEIKFDNKSGVTTKDVLIDTSQTSVTINMFLRGKNVGSIVVTNIENTEQVGKINRIKVQYNFKDNITLNIRVKDFSKLETENQMEQTIVVNGIDGKAPNELKFNEIDKNMMSSNPSNINKWYESPYANISLDSNDSSDLSDLGNAKYAWFVQVIKSNTGFDDDKFNHPELANNVSGILQKTFLQIQGVSPFVGVTYDFVNGVFDVNGIKSAETGQTGAGYYGFFFYTIDLAGNTVNAPLKVFLKTDYIAPKYEIKTDAPDNYFDKVNGVSGKISGSKWSYKDFRLVLEILDPNNAPLDSFSGNYIKFMYDGKEHVLALNKDGFIRYDDYFYNDKEKAFVAYDRNGQIVDRNNNYTRESIELTSFKIWFWGAATNDPTNKLTGHNDNQGNAFTNTSTKVIFEFGVKEPKMQSSISYSVGIGDGTNATLEWTDPRYKHKEFVDSSSSQEKGVKILVDATKPNGVNASESDMTEGLITLNTYKDLITNAEKFDLRKWNTTGNMDLKMTVDQGSTVFIIVSNMNNLVAKYNQNPNLDYSNEIEANDKYLVELKNIFGSDLENPTRLTSTLGEVEHIIQGIFRKEIADYPYPAMVLSTSDTTRGQITVNIPMFMEQFGNGLRNIYMFTVSESGRMSSITTGSVLVDTRTYTIKAAIDDNIKQQFPNITTDQANVWLTKNGKLEETVQFKRGDTIKFNFAFDSMHNINGLGFVPYSLKGRLDFGAATEDFLFYNAAKDAIKPDWDITWKQNCNNLLYEYDELNGISVRLDSLDNIINTLIPVEEAGQQDVTYILDIRKNIDFGISGLTVDENGNYVGKVVIRQNKAGAAAPFWATDMGVLDEALGNNGLSITYKQGGQAIVGKPIGVSDNYTVSAKILPTNKFFVSNVVNLENIPLIVKLQKLQIVVKPSYGSYGDNPNIQYELKDSDGNIVSLENVAENNNGVAVDDTKIQNCLFVQSPYKYPQNRIPIGTYTVVANKEKMKEVFVNGDYEVSVISNDYVIQPRILNADRLGMVDNGKILDISYKFMDQKPDVYFFISKDQLKGFELEFRSIFYNCDYVSIDDPNYYAFKDTYGSIKTATEVTKYSLPGTYSFLTDASAFNISNNFKLELPKRQFMSIAKRDELVIEPEVQSIFIVEPTTGEVTVNSRLIQYKLKEGNAKDGYTYLSDISLTSEFVFTLKQNINNARYYIESVGIPDNIKEGFTTVTSPKDANITVEFMGKGDTEYEYIIYVRQNNGIDIEYGNISYGQSFIVGKSLINTFYKDFEFIIYKKNANTQKYEEQDVNLLELSLKLTIIDKAQVNQLIGVGNYFVDTGKDNFDGIKIKIDGVEPSSVSVLAGQNSIKVNVVPRTIYAVPVLNEDANGNFGMDYYTNNKDKKVKIDNVLVYDNGNSFIKETQHKVVGQFERAWFDNQGFVKYGHYSDGIITNSNYYYGIIEKEPFTINDPNYIIKYDENRPVYKYANNNEKVITATKAKDVKLDIFKKVITLNNESFRKENFVNKTYDGTDIYFIDDYKDLFKGDSVFYDNYIKFDIRYSGDGSKTNGVVDIIIDNFSIAGNKDKVINFVLPSNLTFTFPGKILPRTVILSANDIKIVKEFDGHKKLYNKDIILPESIKNISFDVENVADNNTNVLDSEYIGDYNKIKDFVIKFNIKSDVGLLTFNISGDPTISMLPTEDNTIKLSIKNKQATVNRVKVSAKDFATITAARNRSYVDGEFDVDLMFTFTNEFKTNKLQNLQAIYKYITDDIGLKLVGTIYDGIGTTASKTDQAGQNLPVRITKAYINNGLDEDYNSKNAFFEIDFVDLKNKFDNRITANINKAIISLDIPVKAVTYDGKNPVILDSQKDYNFKNGNTVIATISGAKAELWNKDKPDLNVNVDDPNYRHNIMVTGTLNMSSSIKNPDNYILGGYTYVDNEYKLIEVADHSKNLSALDGKKIEFQVMNAIVILPIEITIDNKIFESQAITGNIKNGKVTKVFDGNTTAEFIYNDAKIVNNEASIKISGNYNSINAAKIKPISINKVEVVANAANNPGCVNNYVIKNNLRSINGEITKRPVIATRIKIKDFEFDMPLGSYATWNQFTGNLYPRSTPVTHNDIEFIEWQNGNGSGIDLQTGFIGNDQENIKITISGVEYETATSDCAIFSDAKGHINNDLNKESKTTYTFLLEDDLQHNISNYELQCTNLDGKVIPKEIYVELTINPDIITKEQLTKQYDGKTNLNNVTIGENFTIVCEEIDNIKSLVTVDGIYENPNVGKRKIDFDIKWENSKGFLSNYRLVNSGVKSTYGTIEPRTIYFGLDTITKVYGDTNITPKFVFYEENTPGAKKYTLDPTLGVPVLDTTLDVPVLDTTLDVPVDEKVVIFKDIFGKDITKADMPTLPNVALVDETTYKSIDTGSTEKNIIFKVYTGTNTDTKNPAVGKVKNTERKIYVYTNGGTKVYGAQNPIPALHISGSPKELIKGLVNQDTFRSIFYDETKQEYLLKGVYTLHKIKNKEGKDQYIYALSAQYKDQELMTEAQVTKSKKGNPNKIEGKYDIYLYDIDLNDIDPNQNEHQLKVTLPKLPLTLKETVNVDYTSSNLITSIFNQSNVDEYTITYKLWEGQESRELPKGTELVNAGTYKLSAQAQIVSDLNNIDDNAVLGDDLTKLQDITTKTNIPYSILTINPIRPSLYFKNDNQFNFNDPINAKALIEMLTTTTKLNEEQLSILRENVNLTFKHRTFDNATYEDFPDGKVPASFNMAGFYQLSFKLRIDDLPNYKYDAIDTDGILIVGNIKIDKVKVEIEQKPIKDNLVFEDGKNNYVEGSIRKNSNQPVPEGYALKVQYVGGLSNNYEFEVSSIGTYKYRFVIVNSEGKYDPNYEVYVNDNGVMRLAEGRNLKIGRKQISDKKNDGSDVSIKTKDDSPIDVEYMTYDVLLNSGQMGWSEVNNYVNSMSGLNSTYSQLTAVVNLGYKLSNGSDAKNINTELEYTVSVPSVLNTAKELQIFYRNSENKLVELTNYHIADGVLTFSSTPVEQLIFVTEQKPELPAWGIVLIVFAVLGFVGIITAIAIVSIRSKKGLSK